MGFDPAPTAAAAVTPTEGHLAEQWKPPVMLSGEPDDDLSVDFGPGPKENDVPSNSMSDSEPPSEQVEYEVPNRNWPPAGSHCSAGVAGCPSLRLSALLGRRHRMAHVGSRLGPLTRRPWASVVPAAGAVSIALCGRFDAPSSGSRRLGLLLLKLGCT
jgi:hypothetical protein